MENRTLGRFLAGASLATIAAAGSLHAAALEQTVPTAVRLLYQEGMYAEFGLAYADPDQSGHDAILPPGVAGPGPVPITGNTGDLFRARWNFSGAFKGDINDRLSYAVLFDQPYGADTFYRQGSFPDAFNYAGSLADVKTYQVSGVLAYDVNPNVKVYGGLRAERLDAKAAVPFVSGYSVDAGKNWGYGYLVGAAYARPEIALRVALTYMSKIAHDLDTDEELLIGGDAFFRDHTSTDVDTPQSVSLEFQTGINPKTLAFGSVRWVDWSEFDISPPLYEQAIAQLIGEPRPLVDYADDWWTYNLGIGRQLTANLAGSVSITYEPSIGGTMTTLGPYDGRTTGSIGLSYDYGQINVTGGLTYGVLGDATNLLDTDFDDGSVWGAGLRVGYTF